MAANKIASSVFSAGPNKNMLVADVYASGDTLVKNALPALLSDTGNSVFEALSNKTLNATSLSKLVGVGEALTGKDIIALASEVPGVDILRSATRLQGLSTLADLGKLTGITSLEAAGALVDGDLSILEQRLSDMTGGESDAVLATAESLYDDVINDLSSTVNSLTGGMITLEGENIKLRGIQPEYVTGALALYNLYTVMEERSASDVTDLESKMSIARQSLRRAVYAGSLTLVQKNLQAITNADIKLVAVAEAIKIAYNRSYLTILDVLVDAIGTETTLTLYPKLPALILASYKIYSDMDSADIAADRNNILTLLTKINPNWNVSARAGGEAVNIEPYMTASDDAIYLLNVIPSERIMCYLANQYRVSSAQDGFNSIYSTSV